MINQTSSPFNSNIQLDLQQQRTLALAAVFQAAQLTNVLATGGTAALNKVGSQYLVHAVTAALNIHPAHNKETNPILFFSNLDSLHLGLVSAEQSLTSPFQPLARQPMPKQKGPQYKATLSYSIALLSLAKKSQNVPDMFKLIQKKQKTLISQLSFYDYQFNNPALISNLAELYSQSVGKLQPTIKVRGQAEFLTNSNTASQIRATLLSGFLAARLWHQLDGSQWRFIFGRRKILADIQAIARLKHQQL